MKTKNIDQMINEMQCIVKKTGEIDSIVDNCDEITVEQIYSEIERLSKTLNRPSGPVRYFGKLSIPLNNNQEHGVMRSVKYELRQLDKVCSKNSFYKNVIRVGLKKLYIHMSNKNHKIVNGRQLLQYDGAEFVQILYLEFFTREVDTEDLENYIRGLENGDFNKIDLIMNLAHSEEGRKKRVYVSSIFSYKIKWVLKKTFIGRMIQKCRRTHRELENLKRQIQIVNKRLEEIEEEKANLVKQQEEDKEIYDLLYLHYNEKLLPDSREKVKNKSKKYIQRLDNYFGTKEKANLKIIDLGCGECEWMELLLENGYDVIGVDSNHEVVCKMKQIYPQFSIIENNAIAYVNQAPSGSADVITAFHMIEHMDALTGMKLIKQCYRVLKPGGMLILETPNPANILTSTYYFHLDPTHVNIIPSEFLAFVIEECGFKVVEKMLLDTLNYAPYEYKENDAISDIMFRFNMEQAYSIRAVKEK